MRAAEIGASGPCAPPPAAGCGARWRTSGRRARSGGARGGIRHAWGAGAEGGAGRRVRPTPTPLGSKKENAKHGAATHGRGRRGQKGNFSGRFELPTGDSESPVLTARVDPHPLSGGSTLREGQLASSFPYTHLRVPIPLYPKNPALRPGSGAASRSGSVAGPRRVPRRCSHNRDRGQAQGRGWRQGRAQGRALGPGPGSEAGSGLGLGLGLGSVSGAAAAVAGSVSAYNLFAKEVRGAAC